MAYCLVDLGENDVGDHARIDGPKIMLKPEAAQNIGLALHELAARNTHAIHSHIRPQNAIAAAPIPA